MVAVVVSRKQSMASADSLRAIFNVRPLSLDVLVEACRAKAAMDQLSLLLP